MIRINFKSHLGGRGRPGKHFTLQGSGGYSDDQLNALKADDVAA